MNFSFETLDNMELTRTCFDRAHADILTILTQTGPIYTLIAIRKHERRPSLFIYLKPENLSKINSK